MKQKVYIKSYGCQMNVYDSDRIIDLVKPLGYQLTSNQDEANLIILNTCHIREKASEKVYSEIGRIKKLKSAKNDKGQEFKLVIAGCVAQAEGKEIKKRAPIVDVIVGPQSYHALPNILKKNDASTIEINTDFLTNEKFDNLNYDSGNSSSAFITIQEGCDKFCTFCVVPYTRGSEYSRPIKDILNEIKIYSDKGVKEVTLLGQNVNSYHGYDSNNKERSLDYLINKISENESIKRIRYMTSHPIDMSNDLIKCHQYNEKLMPFVHLPIQSGSDNILKKMNRKYKVDKYIHVIDKLRKSREDIAISSDFIVGFPGESDKDFDLTMKLIQDVKFSIAYSFNYSKRPGTPAHNFDNQIDENVKKARLSAMQTLLKKQQNDFNKKFLNKHLDVLIEKKGRHINQYVGRSIYNQSIFMESKKNLIGSIVNTFIRENTNFALSGVLNTK